MSEVQVINRDSERVANYRKTETIKKKYYEREGEDPRVKISEELKQITQVMYQGLYQDALQEVERLETRELTDNDRLACQLIKSEILVKKGNFQKALNLAQNVLQESKRCGIQLQVIDAITLMADALWRIGRHNESISAIKQGEQLLKTLVQKQPLEYIQREASLLHLKGIFYFDKGDLDRALEYYQESLTLRERFGNKHDIARSLHYVGLIYERKGELNRAIEYQQQSLIFYEKVSYKRGIAWALDTIGLIHQRKGDLDRAMEHCQKSLKLREEMDNKHDIAHSLQNIGLIHMQKGDIDRAWVHLEQSQAIFEDIGNDVCTAFNLFYLIFLSIDKGLIELTQQYLQCLQQINKREENRVISQQYRVAKALVLKTSPRARKRGKAEELFEQVAEEEIVFYELTVLAILNLCDLLLFELRTIEDEEILNEVKTWSNKLLELADAQHSHSLLAETYILHSKLALLELDVKQARQLLIQAQSLAKEKGLKKLATKISNEQVSLIDQFYKWEKFIDQKPSMSDIIELTQLEDLFEHMIRKRLYRQKEEIFQYAKEAQQLVKDLEKND